MRQKIIVVGLASKKTIKSLKIPYEFSADLSLMNFLMNSGITIASSCNGVGTCKKCIVNSTILSCQISLRDFVLNNEVSTVEVSYL